MSETGKSFSALKELEIMTMKIEKRATFRSTLVGSGFLGAAPFAIFSCFAPKLHFYIF